MRIQFKFPEKNSYQGLYAYDMHFHTEYSMDGISHIPDVLKKAKKLGIGIAITDHNTIRGNIKASKNNKGVTIIPGIEVTGHEGPHILYYFYSIDEMKDFWTKELERSYEKNPFFSARNTFEIIESAKDYNCVITAAHPYGPGITGIKKLQIPIRIEKMIDAIEVLNGYNLHALNLKAIEWAKKIQKGYTGGTDGHTTHELAGTLTVSDGEDIESHLQCIIKNRTEVIGKEENIFEKALLAAIKEERYIQNAEENHEALLLIESQFSTEYSYLVKKLRDEENYFVNHFISNHRF